jgi:hypothetical protein
MPLFIATVIGVLVSASPPAQASSNVGWLYTSGAGGAIFFDADLNGYPGVEKITVCDNETDGHGVMGSVAEYFDGDSITIGDSSHDGHCESIALDYFTEETSVIVSVWEYAGSWTSVKVTAQGVA